MDVKVQGIFQQVEGAVAYRVKLTRNFTSPTAISTQQSIAAPNPPVAGDLAYSFDVPNIQSGEQFKIEIWSDNGFNESATPLTLTATFNAPVPVAPATGTIDIVLS